MKEKGSVGEMPCANAHPAYLGLFMDVDAFQAAGSFGEGEGWASWLVKWPRRGITSEPVPVSQVSPLTRLDLSWSRRASSVASLRSTTAIHGSPLTRLEHDQLPTCPRKGVWGDH